MATTLKALFAGLFGGRDQPPPAAVEPVSYKGFLIVPAPYPSRGQYQTAGMIAKDDETGRREKQFVRAETHGSMEDAVAFSLAKGRQIVDEQGDRLFD